MPETIPDAPPAKPDTDPEPVRRETPEKAPKPSPFDPDWPESRPEPPPKAWFVEYTRFAWKV